MLGFWTVFIWPSGKYSTAPYIAPAWEVRSAEADSVYLILYVHACLANKYSQNTITNIIKTEDKYAYTCPDTPLGVNIFFANLFRIGFWMSLAAQGSSYLRICRF